MTNKTRAMLACALCLALPLAAQELRAEDGALPEVVVEGDLVQKLLKTGQLKSSIIKTESVGEKKIEAKQAMCLAEAIENEPGIDGVVGCSICGMRRVQINGLKGEYTTVLMDGVPLNSTVSSFYGFDALTTAGIAEIEIARGAGAALNAPEAIGGVINIVTKKPAETGATVNAAYGDHERLASIVATGMSKDGKGRLTAAAQHSEQTATDADNNGVNESPGVRNNSALLKYSYDLGDSDNLDLRLSSLDSETYGGSMNRHIFQTANTTGIGLRFDGGDVNGAYTGDPADVTEIIKTKRSEAALKWTHRVTEDINTVATAAGAVQEQDSFYEGADYANRGNTGFGELQGNWRASEAHLFTAGVSGKNETLRSRSYTYFDLAGRPKDDFDYRQAGAYLQDIWKPSESLEISGALRADGIKLDFLGQTAHGNEIDDTVLSPRLHVKAEHGGGFVSRLSYGKGYRAPLTFFESEHGLLDNGFQTLVTKIERSDSAGYTLAYDDDRLTANTSLSWARVKNMAYVDDENYAIPTLVNDTGAAEVRTFDLVAGYQLSPAFSLGGSYERFSYQDRYKQLLGFAAVEDRARLLVGYDNAAAGWSADLEATWVGARNLEPYGYADRYNVYDGVTLSDPKSTHAPSYYTVDLRLSKTLKGGVTIYGGVKNLFGYTQTDDESPLFYDSAGGFDVGHIWGPLRGRELYFGVRMKFAA